ncbi:uncharacterized protein LOC111472819 [Cucurbita maxima]|uniref:Uncharacterized protein LOC111472819 n=1 Tax=Cucurbita maxima TaxID=3661 RepID=A0A6J1IDD3_CUCMA|nr:uncharacterized protein LOC111472819 [Cucurbita maxima]
MLAPLAAPLDPPPIVDWGFDRGCPRNWQDSRAKPKLCDLWSDYLSRGIGLLPKAGARKGEGKTRKEFTDSFSISSFISKSQVKALAHLYLIIRERGKAKPTPKKLPKYLEDSPYARQLQRGFDSRYTRCGKKTDSTRYALPALRFQTCRLLLGNVRNRELTIIQRRILRKLRNKRRSIKRKIYPRENLNSYIQSQTTRKLPLFHGDLPITETHRGKERTSYIPFPLNLETRSNVIPVRLHFSSTLSQARQPISHRRVCVNKGMVPITHFKVSHGDLISFQENDARICGEEIRRSFYIEISVEKIIGKFLDHPERMSRTKTECFHLLKTQRGCRLLLKSQFLQQLRSSMQESDLERRKKFGSDKVCLGSSFAEHIPHDIRLKDPNLPLRSGNGRGQNI